MDALKNQIFTYTLTNDTIVLQEGAKQIYLKNVGDGNVYWTGDKSNSTGTPTPLPSTPVSLGVGQDFEFEPNGDGYKEIEIDATELATTSVEIVAIY